MIRRTYISRCLPAFQGLLLLCLCFLPLFSLSAGNSSGPQEHEEKKQVVLKEIVFIGVERFEKKELLEYLNMSENSFWDWTIFVETSYYNEAYVKRDLQRIVEAYRSFGYFETKVLEFQMDLIDEEDLEGRLTITVEEGKPTFVDSIEFSWNGDDIDTKELEQSIPLKTKEPFETERLNQSREELLFRLHDLGYAMAKVEEQAEIRRDARRAAVRFEVDTGPHCVIDQIRYEGLRMAPAHMVDVEVDFAPGQPYSPNLMHRIEKSVYSMDVFDSVAVIPDKNLNENGKLNLLVRVVESRSQRIKVGPGVGFEPNRWEGRVSMLYTHKSLLPELTRMDLRVVTGYATLPYPWDIEEHGPVFKLIPTFRKKGLLEKKLVWMLRPSFELNVDEGYKFYTPKLRLGVSRFFFGITLAEISYNLHFFDFFDKSPLLGSNKTLLGRDFRDPYLLSFMEFGYTIYFTDDIFEPQNGLVFALKWDLAGTVLGGHFDYHKFEPEMRAYWKVFSHLQLAFRGATGFAFPFAWKPGIPISQKFYLGGSDTVRGWGLKRLAPRIEDCDADGSSCSTLPIGGNTMVMGNLEFRFLLVKNLYFVPFFDVGDVQEGELEYHTDEWSYSTGGGIRFASPIGKFRLDFGYRLNTPERFTGEKTWALHFSLGETF